MFNIQQLQEDYPVEVINYRFHTFISDTDKGLNIPLDPTMDPAVLYGVALLNAYTVRPLEWQDSQGNKLSLRCGAIPTVTGAPGSLTGPLPVPYMLPCLLDINRIANMPNPNWGPYFIHIWGFKKVRTVQGNEKWFPIASANPQENLGDDPQLNPNAVSAGLTLELIPSSGPALIMNPGPINFFNGVGVLPFTTESIIELINRLYTSPTPITDPWRKPEVAAIADFLDRTIGFDPRRTGGATLFALGVPKSSIGVPDSWKGAVTHVANNVQVAIAGAGINNLSTYTGALCGNPTGVRFCECAGLFPQSSLVSAQCGGICKCVDPIGANLRYVDNNYCFGIPEDFCLSEP